MYITYVNNLNLNYYLAFYVSGSTRSRVGISQARLAKWRV